MAKKSVRIILVLLALSVICLSAPGCRDQRQDNPDRDGPETGTVFSIGIVPEYDIFQQRDRYTPLAAYLSKKIGMTVELKTLVSYENVLSNIHSMDLNAAFLGSFTGALAVKRHGSIPVARPQFADGTSTYHGLIFTRKGSGIFSAQDMKGKTFAFVDKETTAGWLFPLHYFKDQHIDDPAGWLGEIYYAGTHEDAIRDVVSGKADIGAAKNTVFNRLTESDRRIEHQLMILASSPPVPANSLCVCRNIDPTLLEKLREALLTMHKDAEGQEALQSLGAFKFVATSVEDYQPVFEYAKEIGLDLATYDD